MRTVFFKSLEREEHGVHEGHEGLLWPWRSKAV